MSKTVRQIVREEIEINQRVQSRREQLRSIMIPTIDLTGWPALPWFIPSFQDIVTAGRAVEAKLKEEFGKDYRKP